jgi:ADP-ribose pyrophosphatase
MSQSNEPFTLPSLIERTIVFHESLIKIQRDRLQIDQHPSYCYYSLITHPFAVAILASTPEGAYLINEEYRHPTGRVLLGCPGGYIDPGEDPLQTAQRELLEETGYKAETFSIMGSAFPYTGISGQKTIYIRARGAILAEQPKLEASEIIHPRLLMPNELLELIKRGEEVDGVLCTALFFNHYDEH